MRPAFRADRQSLLDMLKALRSNNRTQNQAVANTTQNEGQEHG
jgi:hypothetical protein